MQSSYLYTPIPTSHSFDDLRSTGNMRLLRDTDFKGLLARQDLIDWLPQTRAMPILQIRRNESMLGKVEAVLSELQAYRDSLGP